MAALFHDNAGDPVSPTDGCQRFASTKLSHQCVMSAGVHVAAAGSPMQSLDSPVPLLAYHPASCFPRVPLSKRHITSFFF